MTAADRAPVAVLLDVGGVFLVPEHERIIGAFERAECTVSPDVLDDAHYRAATAFTTDLDVEGDWPGCWARYLDAYITACGVEVEAREDVHRHLDSEFADAGLWCEIVEPSRAGVRALSETGVRLGIVSNADGMMDSRLRELELVQVGPGPGVEIGCVIDSGAVGVMKPDPRIFGFATEALGVEPERCWYVGDMPGIDVVGARRAGLHPFVMDPLELHLDADYDRVGSLADLAERITSTD